MEIDEEAKKIALKIVDEFTDKDSCEGGGYTDYHGVPIEEIAILVIESYVKAPPNKHTGKCEIGTKEPGSYIDGKLMTAPGTSGAWGTIKLTGNPTQNTEKK